MSEFSNRHRRLANVFTAAGAAATAITSVAALVGAAALTDNFPSLVQQAGVVGLGCLASGGIVGLGIGLIERCYPA